MVPIAHDHEWRLLHLYRISQSDKVGRHSAARIRRRIRESKSQIQSQKAKNEFVFSSKTSVVPEEPLLIRRNQTIIAVRLRLPLRQRRTHHRRQLTSTNNSNKFNKRLKTTSRLFNLLTLIPLPLTNNRSTSNTS